MVYTHDVVKDSRQPGWIGRVTRQGYAPGIWVGWRPTRTWALRAARRRAEKWTRSGRPDRGPVAQDQDWAAYDSMD